LSHLVAAFNEAFERAVSGERLLCLVIDSSHVENSHRQLETWSIPYRSLFEGTPEESLVEIAPLLVSVNGLEAQARKRLFHWAERLAYAAPCLSWFDTKASPIQIAANLRRFHVVGISEGQSMLMRWYDTRVLPVWLACLTPAQAGTFATGSDNWQYVDRFGQVCTVSLQTAESSVEPPPIGKPILTLSDTQFGMLLDTADLDVLIAHLRRIIPDEIGKLPQYRLTMFVAHHLSAAKQAGLLALYTSGKGIEQPAFKAFIKKPPATLDDFTKKLQALPDDVWDAGRPLWESVPGAQLIPSAPPEAAHG
jgi:Domain of unknown function (DUF4123)